MMFTVAVHGSPYTQQTDHHAIKFCRHVLDAGHSINQVFFYHDGVYAGISAAVPPQGEFDLTQHWQELAQTHQIPLGICIANGIKRGILNADEAKRYEKPAATLVEPFELVGLGQLVAAIAESDRYIEFPA